MSTNAVIIAKNEKGTYDHSYIHWDGYPSNVMKILNGHYTNAEKVKELLSYGDMSILENNIHPSAEKKHSYDSAQRGVCVFYGRDRGESFEACRPYATVKEVVDAYSADHSYLYDGDSSWSEL